MSDNEIEPSDYFMEQLPALQSMTPKGFKKWYNSKEVSEARKECIKLLSKEGLSGLHHTTSETATREKVNGTSSPYKFELWHVDFLAILKGRQAYSPELMALSALTGHQHMCCHIIVRPGKRAEFDAWAEKEALALVRAWRIMLDKNGHLLLIGRMDPFARRQTEQLEQSVSKYVIATAAAADEVTDEECGPGSGLTGDQAHPSYCPLCTR